jgi:hypothetical protein
MRPAAAALITLTFTVSAVATEYPDPPPFHPYEPYAYEKIYYSDETKTLVAGSWTWTCPNIDTCCESVRCPPRGDDSRTRPHRMQRRRGLRATSPASIGGIRSTRPDQSLDV